ncbi:MAG TPA: sulfite exporter TauE/SafE family protein [Thermohalobaculum sp.]|nr:sulfite exporter TauE/SafE family protein [Thermohalobaculum sp.]
MDFFAPLLTIDPVLLAAAAAVMALGGFVKGAVGFALPAVGIAGLGTFMPAHDTVGIMVLPTFASNMWQALRQGLGPAGQTFRAFWKLNLLLALTIGLAAQLVPSIPGAALFIFLGGVVSFTAMLQLAGWRPRAPAAARPRAALEVLCGVLAGILGGISGVWGPVVVFYLMALDIARTTQQRTMGLSFMIGSLVLIPAHGLSGILNAHTLPLGLVLCLPMALGMALGLMCQDRMNPVVFRRATLAVLCLAGLNLLRRGLTM